MLLTLAGLICVVGACSLALQNRKVQNFLIHEATAYFSEKLGAKVQIASVDLELFNKVSLCKTYIEDQKGDTLIYVDKLKMGFEPWQFLRNKFVCEYIELDDASLNLIRFKDKTFNIKFLIDAFKSKKKQPSKFSYHISDIQLKNCRFSYDDQLSIPLTDGRFDVHHVNVKNLTAELSIEHFGKGKLVGMIKSFAAYERSGLKINNFHSGISADAMQAKLKNLRINLPHSSLVMNNVDVKYGKMNNLWKNFGQVRFTRMDIALPSFVTLRDFSCFNSKFRCMENRINISAFLRGSLGDIQIKKISLSNDRGLAFNGSIDIFGLPHLQETMIFARIKDVKANVGAMQDLIASVTCKPCVFPTKLANLGNMNYNGTISGFFSDLVAYGTLKTNIGTLSMDMQMELLMKSKEFNYSGRVKSSSLKIRQLLGQTSQIGNVIFNLSSKGHLQDGKLKGDVRGNVASIDFRDHAYKNIVVDGVFDNKSFNGKIALKDAYANVNFNGQIDLSKKIPVGNCSLNVKNLNPYQLHLMNKRPDLMFSFNSRLKFGGKNKSSHQEQFSIDSLYITNGRKNIFIPHSQVDARHSDTASVITFNSSLARGKIAGQYTLNSLLQSFCHTLDFYAPSLKLTKDKKKAQERNSFIFAFNDLNVNQLADVLGLNLALSPLTSVAGYYNSSRKSFRIEASIPQMTYNKKSYVNSILICEALSPSKGATLDFHTLMGGENNLAARLDLHNDSITGGAKWDIPSKFSGSLDIRSLLTRDEADKLIANIRMLPSRILVKGDEWNVKESTLHTDFKKVTVKDFQLDHDDQFVHIDGVASSSKSDSLQVKVNQFRLSYIMGLVGVKAVNLEAQLTGDCSILSTTKNMALNLDVMAKNFTFNGSRWADVKVNSHWDYDNRILRASCIGKNNEQQLAVLGGEYNPRTDSLSFKGNANGVPLEFLRKYLNGIIDNVSGYGYGPINIIGSLKHPLFEGDLLAKDASFKIGLLGTTYHFSDTISLRQNSFTFKHIKVFDKENHTAEFNGKITHDHFKDFKYNLGVKCKDFQAMNLSSKDNKYFYGTAYGTGNVNIYGHPNYVAFNVKMRTNAGSKVFIPTSGKASDSESSLVVYKRKENKDSLVNMPPPPKSSSEVHVSVLLDATPDAEVTLFTSDDGDMLKATGTGSLRFDYSNKDNLKMYGSYELEKGSYTFTLQQLMQKKFDIRQGGTVKWSGAPTAATLNLSASYLVQSVSLLDIMDETELEGITRTTLPVNCILNLTDDLLQPTIKFDLELPSDAELQRRIKNIVNTDEMMNREILALLVMGRFYRPDYLQTSKTGGVSTEVASILATTVSGQINTWLSQVSDKINVGINARLGNGEDKNEGGEYEVALSYQPNNRLSISSNLGYRNDYVNTTATNNSNIVSDLDVEYKLTKSGKLRAKAYSHSADNSYYSISGTAKSTQGFGLLFREDFNNIKGLFHRYFGRKQKK